MTEQDKFKRHPISIEEVQIKELSIRGNVPPDTVDENIEIKYSIRVGHSDYDEETSRIFVGLSLETGQELEEESDSPYSIKIELVAMFKIDEERFQEKHVNDWARRNAPFILFPYLREQVYALTIRCGYKPLILPLVEVPTFQSNKTVEPPESDQ